MVTKPTVNAAPFHPSRQRTFLITLITLVGLLIILAFASEWYHARQLEIERFQVLGEVVPHGNTLSAAINRRFALLDGVRVYTLAHHKSPALLDENFPIIAGGLYDTTTGIRNFTIAPNGVNGWVYPLEGNENVLGHDLVHDARPDVQADIAKTIESGMMVLSGPYELRQGGLGLVARQAIYDEGVFWGLVGMVLDMPPVLEEAGFETNNRLTWAVKEEDGAVFYGDAAVFDQNPVIAPINVSQEIWIVAGIPKAGWEGPIQETMYLFQGAGLIIALLLTGVTYLVVNRQTHLAFQIAQHTGELTRANVHLQMEIAEREQVEKALRESESKYRGLFEYSPISLWEEDFSAVKAYLDELRASGVSDWRAYFTQHPQAVARCASLVNITNVNQATIDLFQIENQEILSGGLGEIFTDESLHIFREELIVLAEGNRYFEGEIIGRPLSGNPLQCIVQVVIVPGYEQTWTKVFVSVIDITERKRAEKILQLEKEFSETIINATLDTVFVFDPRTGIPSQWNKAFTAISGFTDAEIAARKVPDDWYNETDRQRAAQAIATLEREGRASVEIDLITKDGRAIPFEYVISPIWDGKNELQYVVSLGRDITERQQAHEREQTLALERERVQLLAHFIQDASHEFRTPLSIINTNTYLVSQLTDPARIAVSLGKIEAQTAHINRLVNDLITMARLDSTGEVVNSTTLHPNQHLRQLTEALQTQVEKNQLTLEVVLAEAIPDIVGNADDLELAVSEILDNALHYTPAGGHITVRTYPEADQAVIEIHDTGMGISAEVLPHIFERFYRYDAAHSTPGFGLGLSIARRIIELHRGQIEVASVPGEGSTFTIRLPLAE